MTGTRAGKSLRKLRQRYQKASRKEKSELLDAFCKFTGYHRKYAIKVLNEPVNAEQDKVRRPRGPTYCRECLQVVEAIWKAAGYPWSVRLKAMLPLWLLAPARARA